MKSRLLSIVGNYFKNDRLCSQDVDKAGERRYSPSLEQKVEIPWAAGETRPQEVHAFPDSCFLRFQIHAVSAEDAGHFRRVLDVVDLDPPGSGIAKLSFCAADVLHL